MKKIAIIDYGAGNTASLINAIEYLNFEPVILKKPNGQNFSHIILPGVGAFGKLSENLKKSLVLMNFYLKIKKKVILFLAYVWVCNCYLKVAMKENYKMD